MTEPASAGTATDSPDPAPSQSIEPPVLVTDEASLEAFLEATSQTPVIGVDTESNSFFAYYHEICLIQVSIPGADYVIDPFALDVSPLGEIFADPQREKIFHAAENDILGLKRDFGFEFAHIFDTMWAARILGWPNAGLAGILQSLYGVTLDKRLQRTNWGQRPLQADQLAYAQLDTHYLLALREQQLAALQQRGRWEEAQETFERLTTLEWAEKPFDPEGFWKISGARGLSAQELAVLKELYLLREEEARLQNRPPFKVFDNSTMLSISRKQPRSQRALRQVRGVTRQQLRRYGQSIVAAVARGKRAQPPERPRRPSQDHRPSAQTMARYEALRQWRSQQAETRGVATDVILTNDQLMAIARSAPASLEALADLDILGPWKVQAYGDAILDAMDS